ncbi:response regulator [Thalassotalea ganghwensis]
MTKPSVLIIEDDKDYLELLSEALEDSFNIHCAINLSEAEQARETVEVFDIALVDEHIGEEKGSEWIAKKSAQGNFATSFVLYSGLATEEAILKGLECGADDFLAKPISLLALHNKLNKLIAYQNEIINYRSELSSKDRVINVSMAQASKYGACMQLTSKINSCFTYEQIKSEVFSFLHAMNLEGCIAFYPLNQEPIFYSSLKGSCSPVEIDVMKLLKDKPRLYRFGTRTIFNHPLASILVLHMDEGSIDTDIFIDALASVIESIGSRMTFIEYKHSLVNIQGQIQQAVENTKRMLEISKHHQQQVMNEIVQNVGMSFHVLDMTAEQEDYLTDLVHSALKKHSQDDDNFLSISQLLDSALANLNELNSMAVEQVQIEEVIEDEDELF